MKMHHFQSFWRVYIQILCDFLDLENTFGPKWLVELLCRTQEYYSLASEIEMTSGKVV